MRAVLLGSLLCAAAVGCPAAEPPPRVQVSEREQRYVVDGVELAELHWQLERQQAAAGDMRWHGLTAVWIEVKAAFEPIAQGCRSHSIEVLLDITTQLPQWKPRRSVSRELRKRWDAMLDGLRTHEDGHRQHALDAADALLADLSALEPAADCAAMKVAVSQQIARAKARLALKSHAYDALTAYGAHQGAMLISGVVQPRAGGRRRW